MLSVVRVVRPILKPKRRLNKYDSSESIMLMVVALAPLAHYQVVNWPDDLGSHMQQ